MCCKKIYVIVLLQQALKCMSSKAIENGSEFEVLLQLQQFTRTGSDSVKVLSEYLEFQAEFRWLNIVSNSLTKRQFFMMANNFPLVVPRQVLQNKNHVICSTTICTPSARS